MAGNPIHNTEIAYPKLSRVHINHLIERLRNAPPYPARTVGAQLDAQLIGYLISFYTRRWGLPPALDRRPGTGGTAPEWRD